MFQSSDSDYERQKTLHTLILGTYPMPVKQIITKANPVETPDEQAVCLWKEAIHAIAKAMGTDHIIHVTDQTFKDITIWGPEHFIAFIIPSDSLRRKLKQMRTKEEGIPSSTTTIINQGASNHIPGRPPANPLSYYTYVAPRQPGYQLVSSSSQGL